LLKIAYLDFKKVFEIIVDTYLEDNSILLNDGDHLLFRASWDGRLNNWGRFHCVLVPHPKCLDHQKTSNNSSINNKKNHHTVQSPFDAIPILIAEEGESKNLLCNKLVEWHRLIKQLNNGEIYTVLKGKKITASVVASPDLKALMGILSQSDEESKILYQFLQLVKATNKKASKGVIQNRRKSEIAKLVLKTPLTSNSDIINNKQKILEELEQATNIEMAIAILNKVHFPLNLNPKKIPRQICPFCYCSAGTLHYSIQNPNNILLRQRKTLVNILGLDKEKIQFCCLHCIERLTESLLTLLCKQTKLICDSVIEILGTLTNKPLAVLAGYPKDLPVRTLFVQSSNFCSLQNFSLRQQRNIKKMKRMQKILG